MNIIKLYTLKELSFCLIPVAYKRVHYFKITVISLPTSCQQLQMIIYLISNFTVVWTIALTKFIIFQSRKLVESFRNGETDIKQTKSAFVTFGVSHPEIFTLKQAFCFFEKKNTLCCIVTISQQVTQTFMFRTLVMLLRLMCIKFPCFFLSESVQVNTQGDFYMYGGGLPYVYKTAQFHFHWGDHSQYGAEHTIDGIEYPLEVNEFLNNLSSI